MLSNHEVNHRASESSYANIRQQFNLTPNMPAYIDQVPIILVQPNDQSLASITTTSTTIVQNGDKLTEHLVISIPPSDLINPNPQQKLGV